VQLELDLLAAEITQAKTAQAIATTDPAGAPGAALTLAQIAQAVKDGNATIDTYVARAQQLGYSAADVAILSAELQDQLAAAQASDALHAQAVARTAGKQPSLATMDKAVLEGVQTMAQYTAYLTAQGFTPDAIAILVALLQKKVDAAAAKAAGQ
jgi:hypothetical protein